MVGFAPQMVNYVLVSVSSLGKISIFDSDTFVYVPTAYNGRACSGCRRRLHNDEVEETEYPIPPSNDAGPDQPSTAVDDS